MADDPTIDVRPNGPYLVSNVRRLAGRRMAETSFGEPVEWDPDTDRPDGYETRERYALCRCGQSANKPFCDGSHTAAKFGGELTASHEAGSVRRERIEGSGYTMTDDTTLCADAGFCGTRLTNVWDMAGADDPEVIARAKRMIQFCPSGRLALEVDGEAIEPEFLPSIAPIPNGPLWVRGGIAVVAPDGSAFEVRNRVTLCRCGNSQNKPFCDGAHKSSGFEAP